MAGWLSLCVYSYLCRQQQRQRQRQQLDPELEELLLDLQQRRRATSSQPRPRHSGAMPWAYGGSCRGNNHTFPAQAAGISRMQPQEGKAGPQSAQAQLTRTDKRLTSQWRA